MAIWYDDQGRREWRYNELEAGYGQDYERGFSNDFGRSHFDRPPYQGRPYGHVSWRGRTYPRGTYYGPGQDWQVPGPYTGRGPRGYQRTDERIQEEVCQRLSQHGWLDASNIEVNVNKSEVTLSGSVVSRSDKRLAEEMAESVLGVIDVHNRLRVDKQHYGAAERSRPEKQIHSGMKVMGSDGQEVGQIKEMRNDDFLVDRPMARDTYVPFSAVEQVSGQQVILNLSAAAVDYMGWPQSALIGPPPPDTGKPEEAIEEVDVELNRS